MRRRFYGGQGGMLGIYVSPHYATDQNVYLTYSEPGDYGGSSLALARAKLAIDRQRTASLEGLQVIWRELRRAGAASSARRSLSRPTASRCS